MTTPSKYGLHPAVAHMDAIAANMEKKTGRSIDAWIELVKATGLKTVKERIDWLKREHQLGRDTAMVIAEFTDGREPYDPEGMVRAMFQGPKSALLPNYERLLDRGLALGSDVMAAPCSTYVPLMRKRQFVVFKPTTRTRLDVGFALPGVTPEGRLVEAKGLGSDRITHRIGLESVDEIDAEVERWLKAAYEQDRKG
ncbi:MAG TPA: DUF5655 domain-containing protein [Stenomitos sp.]